MIKIINQRQTGGKLYHYAHFICDCLFPEIINNIYYVKHIIRVKNIDQTIGNFDKIYTEVMKVNNIELIKPIFNKLNVKTIIYKNKEQYISKPYFNKFRNYIFSRYNINHLLYDINYPEVILIKRDGRINLINNVELTKQNYNFTTGKERREIKDIDKVEEYLTQKYENKFKGIFLEHISFKEQVKYFNNAKLIICAHGAAMSNMFFCKEETKILEVTCNCKWDFFNKIIKILNLKHIKCMNNECNEIINYIELHPI